MEMKALYWCYEGGLQCYENALQVLRGRCFTGAMKALNSPGGMSSPKSLIELSRPNHHTSGEGSVKLSVMLVRSGEFNQALGRAPAARRVQRFHSTRIALSSRL